MKVKFKEIQSYIEYNPKRFMQILFFIGFFFSITISYTFLSHLFYSHSENAVSIIARFIILLFVVEMLLIGPFYTKIMKNKKRAAIINNIIFIFFIPLLFSLNIQLIQFGSITYTVEWMLLHIAPFIMGYLLIVLLYCALLCTGRSCIATAVTGAITILLAIINFFKCQFRNEPFLPWDLTSSAELKSIMPQLKLEPTMSMFFCICIYIGLILYSKRVKPIKGKSRISTIAIRTFAFFIILFIGSKYVNLTYFNESILNKFGMSINNWEQTETYNNNGVVSAFVLNSVNLSVEEPEQYSKEAIDNISDKIKNTVENSCEANNETIKKPNIIVIMSEGFWDVTSLPGVEFDNKLLPTIDLLKENYVSGFNFSPKFGGGTSNVEFEALTGFSNQFLPPNSVPYEQYILKPTFSLAEYLKGKGYSTLAIHSNNRQFWNRNTAYKNMSFDNYVAEDNFENPELKRGLISDMEVSKKIISEYEKNEASSDKPWFNYTVTMQNHMAYSSDKWNENEIVKFKSDNLSDSVKDGLSDLATGLAYSDKALGYLIDYFKTVKEPTIIVFFGDHMNLLGDYTEQVFEETGYLEKGYENIDKDTNLYKTPLVIWNNYKELKCNIGSISTFQIMPTVMNMFNLDMPEYFKYLNQGKTISRGYARNVALDSDGTPSYHLNDKQDDFYNNIKMIQYDYMFGNRYSESLFK